VSIATDVCGEMFPDPKSARLQGCHLLFARFLIETSMSETPQIDIDYVANLARLEMSAAEKAKLGAQLNDILGYFDKLSEVDVEGVEPMAHAHRVWNVWREGDQPGATYAPEVLTRMAPEQRDNQVVVPKVVE
jgi:aspartyl-tRNA(Asn)/glutamyl-tRNA(Gln) amidotransferase subunit C